MATPRSLSSVLASLLLLSLFACRCLGATNPEMMTRNNTTRALKEIPKISAVMLTTSKDTRVFETGLKSCLKYLVDVDKFYVITPDYKDVKEKYGAILGERVIFVDEKIGFPFNMEKVGDVMYNTVKEHGTYPLDDGKSQFEKTLWGKLGWFLQQLLKIYAGNVLKLEDYVLLDSDCVWHREVSFISKNQEDGKPTKYYYTTSTQYHPPYIATMKRVAGVDTFQSSKDERFRSGVVHHMVLSKDVLSDLFETSEKLHSPLPFWQVMLNQSALEMTCRAPRAGICGAGSTLSEYELYFNFARVKHPDTVELRPLLWANGPMPGMLYWPDPADDGPVLATDAPKHKWLGHKQAITMPIMKMQIEADYAAGFDYTGYHAYAKRRYFELHDPDIEERCKGAPEPFNTTCSYRGLTDIELRPDRNVTNWFEGCGCFMARHFGG